MLNSPFPPVVWFIGYMGLIVSAPSFLVPQQVAKDPRIERLPCIHQGTYADDCLCERVTQHKCYIVATCDKDLKRRIRKIPGVPIMYIQQHRYSIERLPEATIGGAPRK